MTIRRILFALAAAAAVPASLALAQTPPPATPANPAAAVFEVPFTRGGTSINSDQEDVLNRIIAHAQGNRTLGVVITGIADARGSDSARASRARAMANAVREYLRDNGIPESRTRTAAEGDASPTAINRVEVTFMAR